MAFQGIYKAFGDNVVLQGVDLEVFPGETVAIMGRSGSGKTVLTSMLVGLNVPDQGSIQFAGLEVTRLKTDADWRNLRLKTGYLFQGSALYDSMTVGENVAFPMVQHTHWSEAEITRRVAEKLEQVGLAGTEAMEPAELSGGMQRRAALARSLALDPEIIIYDEPTAGLDPITADEIGQLMRRLQRALKVTSIVVTHDLNLAQLVADRLALLYEARWAFQGTYDEFLQSSHPEVLRFLHKEPPQEDKSSMISRRYETIVGIFVVASLLALLIMVIIIARQEGLFQEYVEYRTIFKNVSGLKVGSEVHLAGVTVGNVKDITISPEGSTLVTFQVIKKYSDRVRADSQASIGFMGLLGDKSLDLTAGSLNQPTVPPEGWVAAVEPLDITQMLAKAGPSLEDLQKILHNLAELTGGISKPGGSDLAKILDQVRQIVIKINDGKGTLGMLVNDSTLYKETTQTVGGAKKLFGEVDKSFFGAGSQRADPTDFDGFSQHHVQRQQDRGQFAGGHQRAAGDDEEGGFRSRQSEKSREKLAGTGYGGGNHDQLMPIKRPRRPKSPGCSGAMCPNPKNIPSEWMPIRERTNHAGIRALAIGALPGGAGLRLGPRARRSCRVRRSP